MHYLQEIVPRKTGQPMKLQRNVLLIIALPLIGALYFVATGMTNKLSSTNETTPTEFGQSVSGLRQSLEKENEGSGLFIGSKGQRFASELLTQRTKTDREIRIFKAFLLTELGVNGKSSKYGTAFKQRLSLALEKLGRLEAYRSEVSSLSITASEAIENYTGLSRSLADLYMASTKEGGKRS